MSSNAKNTASFKIIIGTLQNNANSKANIINIKAQSIAIQNAIGARAVEGKTKGSNLSRFRVTYENINRRLILNMRHWMKKEWMW